MPKQVGNALIAHNCWNLLQLQTSAICAPELNRAGSGFPAVQRALHLDDSYCSRSATFVVKQHVIRIRAALLIQSAYPIPKSQPIQSAHMTGVAASRPSLRQSGRHHASRSSPRQSGRHRNRAGSLRSRTGGYWCLSGDRVQAVGVRRFGEPT